MQVGNDKGRLEMEYLKLLRSGTLAELGQVPADVVGTVVKDGKIVSQFLPLFVPINESPEGWVPRYQALVRAGHDPDKIVSYFGTDSSPMDLIQRCSVRSRQFAANFVRRSARASLGTPPVRYGVDNSN